MDLSDIPFVYKEEKRIFGNSLGEKMLHKEILYNDMAYYFVAIVEGKRVGYIGSWLTKPNAEILNLFVLENYRKKGIAKQLLQTIFRICEEQQIEYITLEVRVSNTPALNLYKKLGFTEALKRINYYHDGEDAVLMVRKIGD
jgi:ribosomal-protein-alanine N-acetyltransferase